MHLTFKPALMLLTALTFTTAQTSTHAAFPKLPISSLPVSAHILVPGNPDWLAIGYGSVWVSNPRKNEIVRIDPERNQVVANIESGQEPCSGIGIGFDYVWVPNCKGQTIAQIDPRSNKVVRQVPLTFDNDGEGTIGAGLGSVWMVTNENGKSSTLTRLDPKSGKITGRFPVGEKSYVVNVGFGSVWVTSTGESKLYRVDPRSGKVLAIIPVRTSPRFTSIGEGSVWVLSQGEGAVSRVDPRTNKVATVFELGVPGSGGEIATGSGFVWVALAGSPVTRINVARNQVIDQYGGYPKADAIRFGFGSVWVSDHGKGEVWRVDFKKAVVGSQ